MRNLRAGVTLLAVAIIGAGSKIAMHGWHKVCGGSEADCISNAVNCSRYGRSFCLNTSPFWIGVTIAAAAFAIGCLAFLALTRRMSVHA